MAAIQAVEFTVEGPAGALAGESMGEGPPVVLLHGVSATRRYVVHGSKALARAGFHQVTYDARGHGRSDPAPPDAGYSYAELVTDLEAVVDADVGDRPFLLGGHSMGAHTAVAYAIENPDRLAGLVLIGPAYTGFVDDEALAGWDRLADGLERGGVDGFMEAYDHGLDPAWRETVLRFTRQRISEHLHPKAVARALREVPRSKPFDSIVRARVHRRPVPHRGESRRRGPWTSVRGGRGYAETLPDASLVTEDEGASPLAWQGGRLSREIAGFGESAAVRSRLG